MKNHFSLKNDPGEIQVQKYELVFEDVAGPPRIDKLFISSIPSLIVYDKQRMYNGPTHSLGVFIFYAKIPWAATFKTRKLINSLGWVLSWVLFN